MLETFMSTRFANQRIDQDTFQVSYLEDLKSSNNSPTTKFGTSTERIFHDKSIALEQTIQIID